MPSQENERACIGSFKFGSVFTILGQIFELFQRYGFFFLIILLHIVLDDMVLFLEYLFV